MRIKYTIEAIQTLNNKETSYLINKGLTTNKKIFSYLKKNDFETELAKQLDYTSTTLIQVKVLDDVLYGDI